MRSLVLGFLMTVVGCAHSNTVECEDGRVCPEGTICATTTVEGNLCVDPGALTACANQPDETPCGTGNSRCYDHVCLPGGCGNRHVDPGEACDDGNHQAGDGCAADCLSDETCGNGRIEAVFGELCDDGNPLSGDGCSSACQLETPDWREESLLFSRSTANAAIAYDTARDRVVQFDGTNSGVQVDATSEWDGVGVVTIRPPLAPKSREGARMVYDTRRRRIVLFGGGNVVGALGPYSDTWTYDGVTWTPLATTHTPPARLNHVMVYDSKRDRVVLFGGSASLNNSQPLADLWTFDGVDWHLETGTGPSARFDAGFAYDPSRAVSVLAGGATAVGAPVADAWTLDASGWHAAAALPQARSQLSLAFEPTGKRILAIGGVGPGNTMTTAVHAFDGSGWTLVAGVSITRRSFGAVTRGNGDIVVYAGYTSTGNSASAVIHVIANGVATLASAQVPATSRTEAGVAHIRGKALLFGGLPAPINPTTQPPDFVDTWEVVGKGMIKLSPAGSPTARHGHAMAYDPDRDRVVLFGGVDRATPPNLLSDTWLWDGATWTQVFPANAPSARKWHSMVWDAARHQIVLYGGITNVASATAADDTWAWDGTTWTPRTTGMPPARARAAADYDPVREKVILFGGRDDNATGPYNDTWEWDGSTWTQRMPDASPSPRAGSTIAWNPARQHLVLTSGLSSNDTWEWNGDTWREVFVATTPTTHEMSSAFIVQSGSAWVSGDAPLGCVNAPCATNAYFALRWASAKPEENCRSTGFDVDGDGKIGCADPDCWFVCDPDCPPGTSCAATRPRCGDGTCSNLETCRSCSADCGACTPVCGDSLCEGETSTCPGDCP